MTWQSLAQTLLLLFVGAWIHWRGSKQANPLPGAEVVEKLGDLIEARRKRNAGNGLKPPPTLPGKSLL